MRDRARFGLAHVDRLFTGTVSLTPGTWTILDRRRFSAATRGWWSPAAVEAVDLRVRAGYLLDASAVVPGRYGYERRLALVGWTLAATGTAVGLVGVVLSATGWAGWAALLGLALTVVALRVRATTLLSRRPGCVRQVSLSPAVDAALFERARLAVVSGASDADLDGLLLGLARCYEDLIEMRWLLGALAAAGQGDAMLALCEQIEDHERWLGAVADLEPLAA